MLPVTTVFQTAEEVMLLLPSAVIIF